MSGEYEYVKEQARLRHPSVRQVTRWFDYRHLASGLPRDLSSNCSQLARYMVESLPDDPELTVGLRKLLEAKDCFVRAAIAAQRDAGQ